MRRAAIGSVLVVVLAACGGAAPGPPVVVPVRAGHTAPLELAPSQPALKLPDPFEIVMSSASLCVIADGKAYCPPALAADEPRVAGPPLDGLSNVAALSFGRDFHCIATRDGRVACGGGNRFGQLGAGVAEESSVTKPLPGLARVKKLVSGPFSSCAILDDGKLACWGKNESGETGSPTNVLPDARALVEPETVAGIQDVTEVAIGWGSTCAATSKGDVACWGTTQLREHRKLRGARDERPTVLPSLAGTTSLTANEQSFCGVRNAKVVCWGQDGTLVRDPVAERATELAIPDARRVSLGRSHGCAIGRGGDVYCFGAAYSGALGSEATNEDYRPRGPEKVRGLPPVETIVCGSSLSCAVTAGHDLFCWGRFGPDESDHVWAPVAMSVLPVR